MIIYNYLIIVFVTVHIATESKRKTIEIYINFDPDEVRYNTVITYDIYIYHRRPKIDDPLMQVHTVFNRFS